MTEHRTTAAVTGATGLVGSHVVSRLLAFGHSARALVRGQASAPPAPAVVIRGTVADDAALDELLHDAEAVVHCAAQLTGDDAALWSANVDGTTRVLDAARRHAVPRVVLASSIAVYTDGPLQNADERHPLGGGSTYARSKQRAEQLVRDFAADGAHTAVIARLPLVLGPGDRHTLPLLERLARDWLVPTTATGGAALSVIHAADAADALVRCAFRALGDDVTVVNVPGTTVRAATLIRAAARALDTSATLEVVDDAVVDASGRVVPGRWPIATTRAHARSPLPPDLVPAALVDRTVDGALARRSLDFNPTHDVLADLASWLAPLRTTDDRAPAHAHDD